VGAESGRQRGDSNLGEEAGREQEGQDKDIVTPSSTRLATSGKRQHCFCFLLADQCIWGDPAKSVLPDRPARPFCKQNCACKSSECWPCNGPAVREQRIMSSGAGLSKQTLALSISTGRKHREHAHGRV